MKIVIDKCLRLKEGANNSSRYRNRDCYTLIILYHAVEEENDLRKESLLGSFISHDKRSLLRIRKGDVIDTEKDLVGIEFNQHEDSQSIVLDEFIWDE